MALYWLRLCVTLLSLGSSPPSPAETAALPASLGSSPFSFLAEVVSFLTISASVVEAAAPLPPQRRHFFPLLEEYRQAEEMQQRRAASSALADGTLDQPHARLVRRAGRIEQRAGQLLLLLLLLLLLGVCC